MRDVVTIDGPAASGKSTVAYRVAARLGVPFVSSGLLYRAATRLALDADVDPAGEEGLVALLTDHDVHLVPGADGNRVLVDGCDVTGELHTDRVDEAVSTIAARPRVRDWVNARLREIDGSFVIDGRDMGKDVFPDAVAKVYLTARPEVRAARRVGERAAALDEITDAIRRRDALDARQSAPAEEATRIDTSDLDLDQVVARVLSVVASRRGAVES